MKSWLAPLAICLAASCWAQSPASGRPASAASAAQDKGDGPAEPKVERTVSEDDNVRIDELRVRGQTRRIVVQSKVPGAPAYEIVTRADGRDASQDQRTEGRALWQLFSF